MHKCTQCAYVDRGGMDIGHIGKSVMWYSILINGNCRYLSCQGHLLSLSIFHPNNLSTCAKVWVFLFLPYIIGCCVLAFFCTMLEF